MGARLYKEENDPLLKLKKTEKIKGKEKKKIVFGAEKWECKKSLATQHCASVHGLVVHSAVSALAMCVIPVGHKNVAHMSAEKSRPHYGRKFQTNTDDHHKEI